MNDLMVFRHPEHLSPTDTRSLARCAERMELMSAMAQAAMDEVSSIHTYGVYKATTTMMTAEALRQTFDAFSPAQQALYEQFARSYLTTMRHITEEASAHVIQSLHPTPSAIGVLDTFIDWLKEQ